MPHTGKSVIERGQRDGGVTCVIIRERNAPRPAADLAVLDVILDAAAPRIEPDLDALAAVRADHERIHLGGAVAEWKLFVELGLELGIVVAVGLEGSGEVVGEAHPLMIVRGRISRRTGRGAARRST